MSLMMLGSDTKKGNCRLELSVNDMICDSSLADLFPYVYLTLDSMGKHSSLDVLCIDILICVPCLCVRQWPDPNISEFPQDPRPHFPALIC
jgi:hypothetical protein